MTARKKRILMVGEAPGPRTDPELALDGPSGRRLTELLGQDWRRVATAKNLLDRWPGSAGLKGSSFPMRRARAAARRFRSHVLWRYGLVLLLGLRVAAAFGFTKYNGANFFGVFQIQCGKDRKVTAYTVPHPSGISHWWNYEINVGVAERFFRHVGMAQNA